MIPQRLIIIGARRWWLEGEEGRSRMYKGRWERGLDP